jgi:hypothetical protein
MVTLSAGPNDQAAGHAGGHVVRKHIEGLGLTLPRLYRLNRFARNNAIHEPTTGLAAECEAQGTTAGQWRVASRLVHSAALSILLDVPAQNRHDAIQLADLVANALDPLPKDQRSRVGKQLSRYFAAMLDGKHVLDAPKQWVMAFTNDSMAWRLPSLLAAMRSMSGTRASRARAVTTSMAPVEHHGRAVLRRCAG